MSSKNDLPTGCNSDESAPDGPAVVPDGDSSRPPANVGRRTFLKGIGATAATGVALSLDNGPVQESEAIAPLLAAGAIGLAAGAVSGVAFGSEFLGPDDEAVDGTLSYDNHLGEYTRSREDDLMMDQTLASLKRDVQLVENKAREEAIFKVFEAGVDDLSEADATSNANTAVDEAFGVVERSLLATWQIRSARHKSLVDTNLVPGGSKNVIAGYDAKNNAYRSVGSGGEAGTGTNNSTVKTHTLVDGSTIDIGVNHSLNAGNYAYYYDPTNPIPDPSSNWGGLYFTKIIIKPPDSANYSGVDSDTHDFTQDAMMLDTVEYAEVYQNLMDEYNAMKSEVSDIVASYYTPAKNGEIDLYETVGPAHLTDTASVATDYQEATMALRAMGFPISKQVVTIEISTKDGSTLQLTGRLSWTAHQGNSLSVGVTHRPTDIPGSIYAAVNLPDGVTSLYQNQTNTTTYDDMDGPGAETIELTDEFDIVSAEGADGVTFENRDLASVTGISNEEINQIFKENYLANKEATETVHDTSTGGGGGFSLSGLSNTQIGAGLVAAAIGLGLLND